MVSLFVDPKQVVRSDKITEFWPTNQQTKVERVNAQHDLSFMRRVCCISSDEICAFLY